MFIVNAFQLENELYILCKSRSFFSPCLHVNKLIFAPVNRLSDVNNKNLATALRELDALYEQQSSEHVVLYVFPASLINDGTEISFDNDKIQIMNGYLYDFANLKSRRLFVRMGENKIHIECKKSFLINILKSKKYSLNDKILFLVAALFPKKNYIFSEIGSLRSDNSYALFLYMKRFYKNCYFITDDINQADFDTKFLARRNSFKHLWLLLTAKCLVHSWHICDVMHRNLKDIHYNAAQFSNVFICHGITAGDKNSYEISRYNWGNADICFAGIVPELSQFQKLGYRTLLTGYPRFDKWCGTIRNVFSVALFFTWRRNLRNLDEFKSSLYFHYIRDLLQKVSKVFPEYTFYYIFHSAISSDCRHFMRKEFQNVSNVLFVDVENQQKFIEVFNNSGRFITDYSSIAFDFAYKKEGCPIYFLPKGIESQHYALTDYFYKIQCGVVATTEDQVISYLSYCQTTEKRKNSIFQYRDANNSKRAMLSLLRLGDY